MDIRCKYSAACCIAHPKNDGNGIETIETKANYTTQ